MLSLMGVLPMGCWFFVDRSSVSRSQMIRRRSLVLLEIL